jgi:glycosyltransferase involved in cell wall biosynthesis
VDLALASLCRQTTTFSEWEVLLVENDNEASPAMAAVVQRYMQQLPLRHIVETSVGLSYARNTAAREARGEYVAYLDDDAEADPAWLAALVQECRESQPDFCGGPSYPLYRTPKPDWYLDRYGTGYVYGEQPRWLGRDEWLGGMNFIVKRALCAQLGGFRTDLGMIGNTTAYGEDTEFLMRAWTANPQLKVRYLPQASIRHEVRPEKMTLRWKVKAAWAGGCSSTIMSPQNRKQAIVGLMRNAKWIIKQVGCAGLCWRRDKKERLRWQQWVFEEFSLWLWNFSRNWHALFRWRR